MLQLEFNLAELSVKSKFKLQRFYIRTNQVTKCYNQTSRDSKQGLSHQLVIGVTLNNLTLHSCLLHRYVVSCPNPI